MNTILSKIILTNNDKILRYRQLTESQMFFRKNGMKRIVKGHVDRRCLNLSAG